MCLITTSPVLSFFETYIAPASDRVGTIDTAAVDKICRYQMRCCCSVWSSLEVRTRAACMIAWGLEGSTALRRGVMRVFC